MLCYAILFYCAYIVQTEYKFFLLFGYFVWLN